MKKVWIVVLLLYFVNVSAQIPQTINLPEGGRARTEDPWYFESNIYVTKEQHTFNGEGKQFGYFTEISHWLFQEKNKLNPTVWLLPTLYADADTRFSFIEQVIRQMAVAQPMFIQFATQEKGKKHEVLKITATLLKMDKDEIIPWQEKTVSETAESEDDFFSSIPPPPAPWYLAVHSAIYSGNPEKVKKVLNEYQYAVLKVLPNSVLEFQGKPLNINDLPKIMTKNQILFLRFDKNLKYKDYIYAVDAINKASKKVKAQKESSSYPIDIFSELEYFLEENEIEL